MVVRVRLGLTLALSATLGGCDGPLTACDLSFGGVGLTVQRADGSPVVGLAISDTILRTRRGFAVPQRGNGASGGYIVIDDGYVSAIRQSGEFGSGRGRERNGSVSRGLHL